MTTKQQLILWFICSPIVAYLLHLLFCWLEKEHTIYTIPLKKGIIKWNKGERETLYIDISKHTDKFIFRVVAGKIQIRRRNG